MLRNLVLLGVAAIVAMAVPAVYEANPDVVRSVLSQPDEAEASRPQTQRSQPSVQHARTEPEALLGRKVRLASDERGHFLGDFRLNGRRVEGVVDTGATLVAINRTTARRIGIRLVPADFAYEVNTANGTARAAPAVIEELQIGRIVLREVEALVLEDRALQTVLIGMSFLKRLEKFQVEDGALLLVQ